jgi:hypothetical protein
MLPNGVGLRELDRYRRLLDLSDAQMGFAQTLYEQYLRDVNELKEREEPALSDAAVAAAGGGDQPEGLRACEEFASLHARIAGDLRAADHRFLDGLQAILAEDQRPELAKVNVSRERSAVNLLDALIPGANIDVRDLFERTVTDPEILKRLDGTLCGYDEKTAASATALYTSHLRRAPVMKRPAVYQARAARGEPVNPAEVQAARDERAGVLARDGGVESDLARANEQAANDLAAALPERERRAFLSEYQRLAYPGIYPDDVDQQTLIDRLRPDDLSGTQWEAVQLVVARHATDSARASHELEATFLEWRTELAATRTARAGTYASYRTTMRALREHRWTVHERFLKDLQAILPPGSPMQGEVASRMSEIDSVRSRAVSDVFPGG